MSFPASFVKLADDTWGVRVPRDQAGAPLEPGATLMISTRAGAMKEVTLAQPMGFNRYGDQLWSLAPQAKPAQATMAVGDLGGVLAIFDRAKANLKRPAIVLAVPKADNPKEPLVVLHLSLAGPKAKVPGSITVCDDGRWVSNDWGSESREWLGRVTREGDYQPARAANGRTEAIAARLRAFACEPARIAKESATLTGRCVFCNQALGGDSDTAKKSLAVGYGQTCAKSFGLPWGEAKLDIGQEG